MNKLSIIGGAGFIGSYLCNELDKKNIDFEILDLKKSKSYPSKSKITDIRDRESLCNHITGNMIIHLAAVHTDNINNYDAYHQTNVSGTKNIIDVAKEKSINKIIFTSSVAVYGDACINSGEDAVITPNNYYGISKYEAEKILNEWKADDNQLIIIRPTVVFGTGNRGNFYNLLNQIKSKRFAHIGSGKNIKSIAYIENLISFICTCIKTEKKFGLYNYVDTPNINVNQLVDIIKSKLGIETKFMKIPYLLALSIGYLADIISKITSSNFKISSVRVKKFCSNSCFLSSKNKLDNFSQPIDIESAINKTIENEFISKDKNFDIYFTE